MNEALVVMSKWDEEFNIGLLQVVKQNYRGNNFFKSKSRFTSSDEVNIESLVFPSFQGNILYVRGSDMSLDNKVVFIKDFFSYNKVLEAVFQYNEAMAESIDYFDLHHKLWMKLAETGATCKNVYAAEIAREASLLYPPRRGCFLCEEAATDPVSTNCK
jgi:antitoxin component YwqK of YwqJK toxin-antitoxin module